MERAAPTAPTPPGAETPPPRAEPTPPAPAGWRARGAAAALHLALAVGVTWPMVLQPGARAVGHPEVDVWNHAWGPWWFAASAAAGHVPLATRMLGAPGGGRLWYIDPVGAAIGAPFVGTFGAIVAYNIVIFVYVLLASVAGRRLALALGATPATAWVGAVGAACSPYLLSEIHNGVSEACGVAWALFALAALAKATREAAPSFLRGLLPWAAVGFWGGVTAVGSPYYALGLALVATPIVLVALLRTRLRALPGVLLGALVAACLAVPAFTAAAWTVADPAHALIQRDQGDWTERMGIIRHNAVDPRSFFLPGFQSVDLAALGEKFLHSSYLGWLLLLALPFSRRPAWLVAAGVGLVFSLGPFLWWDQEFVYGADGRPIALPYAVFLEHLPAGTIGHPQRVGAPAIALVAALAAVAAARLPLRLARAAPALVALELLWAAPWPVPHAEFPDRAVASRIRADAAERGLRGWAIVLDLPGDAKGRHMLPSRYLVGQTVHGLPIPYAPDVRMNTNRLVSVTAVRALVDPNVRGGSAEELARAAVGWVVLHPDIGDVSLAEERLRAWLGEPEEHDGALLFRVPDPQRPSPRPRDALIPPWFSR